MQAIEELAAAKVQGGAVVTIGVFDGVHLGHHYLIEQVKAQARERGLSSAVVTFRNHPRSVLAPGSQVTYLCPLEERLELLRAAGAAHVIPLSFTQQLSQLTARQFVELLVQHLGMRGLLVGPDFALGKGREGTAPVLEALGNELGYTLTIVEPFSREGQVVSSTAVRRCLGEGEMETAARLLGRPFTLGGAVVEGDKRGRTIGFPTANIDVPADMALPADGIYCTIAHVGGESYHSATNIGVRPTFGQLGRTVETYILDFQGDLYGQHMRIELVHRLRPEERFSSVEALVAQMKLDVEAARGMLAARRSR